MEFKLNQITYIKKIMSIIKVTNLKTFKNSLPLLASWNLKCVSGVEMGRERLSKRMNCHKYNSQRKGLKNED